MRIYPDRNLRLYFRQFQFVLFSDRVPGEESFFHKRVNFLEIRNVKISPYINRKLEQAGKELRLINTSLCLFWFIKYIHVEFMYLGK